ncbi:MAG: cyclase family protein [Thermomicrobiales bacterium]|nr:cyclase family protein [Thermomicrobiales bacterium]
MSAPTPGSMLGRDVLIYDLEQPRFQGMPIHESHMPGYAYFLHRRHEDYADGPRSGASGVIVSMEHAGTHIDALSHQSDNQTLYGGVSIEGLSGGRGFSRHGVEEIAPIVAPALLLDIAGHRGVEALRSGEVVTRAELEACAAAQGVSIGAGDVVLVRTGNGAHWNDVDTYLPGPGMDGDCSIWLRDLGVLAVGADNMAWDVIGLFDEEAGCELPGHLYLLARAGIFIIENLNLETLAADRRWTFTFVCTPLKFNGATGSPVRPVAIVQKERE